MAALERLKTPRSFREGLPLATCCDIDQGRQIKSEEALTAKATTADLAE